MRAFGAIRPRRAWRVTYTEEVLVTVEVEAATRADAIAAAVAGTTKAYPAPKRTRLRTHGATAHDLEPDLAPAPRRFT